MSRYPQPQFYDDMIWCSLYLVATNEKPTIKVKSVNVCQGLFKVWLREFDTYKTDSAEGRWFRPALLYGPS